MKKLAFISGAISFSLTSLSYLFHHQLWPGGNIALVLGIGLFALVFVPSMFKYLYDREK